MEAQKYSPEVYEQTERLMELAEELRKAQRYAELDRINEEISRVQRHIAEVVKAQEDYEKARRAMGRAS